MRLQYSVSHKAAFAFWLTVVFSLPGMSTLAAEVEWPDRDQYKAWLGDHDPDTTPEFSSKEDQEKRELARLVAATLLDDALNDVRRGQRSMADAKIVQADKICKDLESDQCLGDIHFVKGELNRLLGRSGQVYREMGRARRHYEAAGYAVGIANVAAQLADVERDRSHLSLARKYLLEARQIYEGEGHARGLASVAVALAEIELMSGELDNAEMLYQDALANFGDVRGDLDTERAFNLGSARAYVGFAGVLMEKGKAAEALEMLSRASGHCEAAESRWCTGNLKFSEAKYHRWVGNEGKSLDSLYQARAIFHQIGNEMQVGGTYVFEAELVGDDDPNKAKESLWTAMMYFRKINRLDLEDRARAALQRIEVEE